MLVLALLTVPAGAAVVQTESYEEERMRSILAFLATATERMEASGIVVDTEAVATSIVVPGIGPTTSLSLEESIRIAVENNPDIAIARIEHEQAIADLREARRGAINIRISRRELVPVEFTIPGNDGNMITVIQDRRPGGVFTYDLLLAERILPKTMEMMELLSYKNVEFSINLVKFQVENAYYGVLRAEAELQNSIDSLSRSREQLRITEVGFSAGINARADVIGTEASVASQELVVAFAENSLKQARMDFSNLLGLPLSDEITLTSSFRFTPVEFSFDEIKERAQERDIAYVQLHKSYEIQREILNLAGEFYTPNVLAYQEARRDYDIARLRLQNADQELELRIRRALLNVATAQERFSLMEQSVEQAQENHRLTNLRFEVGMATLLEIERASGEIDNAKAEQLSAIYDYNLAVTMLQHGLFDLGRM